ncbi:MAG TPA: B12-binding domain-containing radical SAM protein [Chitinophagales bacterium]|nr:B12-binding domain-containing radical SAM protein [Chitinophagales bacterium]
MSKPRVFLADLKHNYTGVLTSDSMPLGIGYMKAVMDRDVREVDSTLFVYPDKLLAQIKLSPPDVLMLTNYMWNEALSHHFAKLVRQYNPDALIVMGGPNIPIEAQRQVEYVKRHPHIDIYVTGEGDFLAAEIVSRFLDAGLSRKKALEYNFHSSVYRYQNEDIIVNPLKPRTRQLDDIPSPWLTGVMDDFFDGKMAPLIETNRGCPFTCTFCVQGTKWYTKVNYFSLERLRGELHYIGRTINKKCSGQRNLKIADANFGMYERDEEIATYIAGVQREFNYPLIIDATTGKNHAERIIKAVEKVNGALIMYLAVQSIDENVLANIKRHNISLQAYSNIQMYLKARGLRSNSDLILALPGETLETHLNSLKWLVNSGTDRITCFQAHLLKGSELESLESRAKFQFTTKYRLAPRLFGEYEEKVFDIDEVIVSTNSFTYADYLTARKYHFGISVLWNGLRFEGLIKVLERMGVEKWAWLDFLIQNLDKTDMAEIRQLLSDFIAETEHELFDSSEAVVEYYSHKENFELLKKDQAGDNLIYKYRGIAVFYFWDKICEFVFSNTLAFLHKSGFETDGAFAAFMEEATIYFTALYAHGTNGKEFLADKTNAFTYNVGDLMKLDSLTDFESLTIKDGISLKFYLPQDSLANIEDSLKIWNYTPESFSMFVRRIDHRLLTKHVEAMVNV